MNEMLDAELIRHLDGELDAGARAKLEALLASAPAAVARRTVLQRRAARLSVLLRTADPGGFETGRSAREIRAQVIDARIPVWRRRAFKAAAVIVALLGFSLAVPPVRAWVLDRVDDVARVLGLRAAAHESAAPPAVQSPEDAAVSYTFPMSTDTLEIFLAHDAGRLRVQREDRAQAMVEAVANEGAGLVVLPSGLRIERWPGSQATFTVQVPARVTMLRIQRGNQRRMHHLPAAGLTLELDLSAR